MGEGQYSPLRAIHLRAGWSSSRSMREVACQSIPAYSVGSARVVRRCCEVAVCGRAGESSLPSPQMRQPVAPSMALLMESRSHPTQHLTETTSEPSRPRLSRTPRWGLSLRSWQMPGRGHQPEEERRAAGLIRRAMASASIRWCGFMERALTDGCATWCE